MAGRYKALRPGITCTMGEFAKFLGRTESVIREWIRKGMPVSKHGTRGEQYEIDSAAAVAWLVQDRLNAALGNNTATDLDEAKRRKLAAEAEIAELTLAERRGEVAPIEIFQQVWEQRVAGCRARLLAIPTKAAPQCVGEEIAKVKRVLEDFIREALEELAAGNAGTEANEAGPTLREAS